MSTLKSAKQILWNLGLITLGSVLCASGIKGILIPGQFLSGGFTGVAIIIHYLIPSIPVAMLYFILNIPIYIWDFSSDTVLKDTFCQSAFVKSSYS